MTSWRKYLREISLAILMVMNLCIWYIITSQNTGNVLSVYFLNVGQGDAIFIVSPTGNQMLIDAGAGNNVLQELANIVPFFDKDIDVIMATHADADHIGGFIPLLARFHIQYVMESGSDGTTEVFKTFQNLVDHLQTTEIIARRGMTVDLGGGAIVLILFPDRDISGINPNDSSIIAKLFFGETSFMLTGDAPQKIEEYLVSLDGKNLESDVLKVGHHGSRTSSALSFIEAVKADYAVIQAGKNNRYGHPHKEVLDLLAAQHIKILGNYEKGTILFTSDGKTVTLK